MIKPSSSLTYINQIMECHRILLMYEASRKQMKVQTIKPSSNLTKANSNYGMS